MKSSRGKGAGAVELMPERSASGTMAVVIERRSSASGATGLNESEAQDNVSGSGSGSGHRIQHRRTTPASLRGMKVAQPMAKPNPGPESHP